MLSNEYEELKHKIEKIDAKLRSKKANNLSTQNFLDGISARENLIDVFDEKLFTSVVDKIVVKSYAKATIVFKN